MGDRRTAGNGRTSPTNDLLTRSYSGPGVLARPPLDHGADEVVTRMRVRRPDDHAVVWAGLASVDHELVPERVEDGEATVPAELGPACEDSGDLLRVRESRTSAGVPELGIEGHDEVLVEEGGEPFPHEVGVGAGVVGRVLPDVVLEQRVGTVKDDQIHGASKHDEILIEIGQKSK